MDETTLHGNELTTSSMDEWMDDGGGDGEKVVRYLGPREIINKKPKSLSLPLWRLRHRPRRSPNPKSAPVEFSGYLRVKPSLIK